jgi:tetratricopeptide (TPR) repeat protein
MAMLQRALELAGKLPAVRSAAIENALLEDLASMTAASFETVDRAVESYETLAARARQHGLVAAEVNVLIGMCYLLVSIDSERCGEVTERVLELGAVQSDPLLRARARACGLYFRLWTRGWDDGKFQEFERALSELRRASASDRGVLAMKNAWYLHNQLEHGLTDLWLAQGDLAQARPQAERFLEVAQALPEHTYRARAWEANVRVAMADGSLDRARDCIDHALSAMEGFDVPLAAWQVHATAAEVCRRAENEQSAQQHQERSRKTILMLADSLPAEEQALRQTFLSAAPIAKILGMSQNFAPTVTP